MFDIAPTELLMVALIALVVIGPKDLPRAMRVVGKWMGKARGMARHFRSGFDTMMREAELEELEKQWRQQNEDIMRQFPRVDEMAESAAPAPSPDPIPDLMGGEDGLRPATPPPAKAPRRKRAQAKAVPDAPAAPPQGGELP